MGLYGLYELLSILGKGQENGHHRITNHQLEKDMEQVRFGCIRLPQGPLTLDTGVPLVV